MENCAEPVAADALARATSLRSRRCHAAALSLDEEGLVHLAHPRRTHRQRTAGPSERGTNARADVIATSPYRACAVVYTGDLVAELPTAPLPAVPAIPDDPPTRNRWLACLDAVDPDSERATAKRIARSATRAPTRGELRLVLEALERL